MIYGWAPKVKRAMIARLYYEYSSGIEDAGLMDTVGWELCARCESIISVTSGYEEKKLICPRCG